MATLQQINFLQKAYLAASQAKHPWPDAAACESAAETGWGISESVSEGNNLLGIHAPSWWTGGTFVKPTQEEVGDTMVTDATAKWSAFSSWIECFECQIAILQKASIYAEALAAHDAPTYIQQVSAEWALTEEPADNVNIFTFEGRNYLWVAGRWSTGHSRASTVLSIWTAHHAQLVAV